MELRGTELAPDYAIYSGNYDPGDKDNEPSDIASPDERRRQVDSSVLPHRRFHYRSVAIEHLLLAANDLPFRTDCGPKEYQSWVLQAAGGSAIHLAVGEWPQRGRD